jgi:hypothetical protein
VYRNEHHGPCPPVLLIIFNRPRHTRAVLAAIRKARPTKLFVAADGPRADVKSDATLCRAARDIVEEVDWPCEVSRLSSSENLGCKAGPETAISWFFENVEAGVVLEDDCLPAASFFDFSGAMLDRYADRNDVMMVCGSNAAISWKPDQQSYHYAYNATPWGWASWRNAWREYDSTMSAWKTPEGRARVAATVANSKQERWRKRQFDRVCYGGFNTWDYVWTFTRLQAGAASVIPSRNLVSNIGFGPEATHTTRVRRKVASLPTSELRAPFLGPRDQWVDHEYDQLVYRRSYPLIRRAKHGAQSVLASGSRKALFRSGD